MKKLTFPIILIAAAGYTYLFYHQLTGINYLVFDALVLILLIVTGFEKLNRLTVWISLAGLSASAIFVFMHNTGIAVLMHWICFGLFVRLFYTSELSLYLALPEQIFISVISIFNPDKWKELSGESEKSRNWLMYLLMLPILAVFIYLYSSGNELYGRWISKLFDFEFHFSIIPFFLSGIIISFSLFAPYLPDYFKIFDRGCLNQLSRVDNPDTKSWLFGSLNNEQRAALFLLVMLNLVTFSFHATDIYYFFVPAEISKAINFSENLHQGVNSLIISIALAIVIVLYFFRGELNFFANNKSLKVLTYGWLLQNVVLAITTSHRNLLYIDSLGLTHKRIGVFVWLVLVAAGILFTLIKIAQTKSLWFLLRANTWAIWVVLISYSSVNWDRIIVRHNLTNKNSEVDFGYLASLGESAIGEIHEMALEDESFKIPKEIMFFEIKKAKRLTNEYQGLGWQSFNLESERIEAALKNDLQTSKTAHINN